MQKKLLSDPISRPERAQGHRGEKKLHFNRKKPPSEPEPEPAGGKNTVTPFKGYLLEQGNTR